MTCHDIIIIISSSSSSSSSSNFYAGYVHAWNKLWSWVYSVAAILLLQFVDMLNV